MRDEGKRDERRKKTTCASVQCNVVPNTHLHCTPTFPQFDFYSVYSRTLSGCQHAQCVLMVLRLFRLICLTEFPPWAFGV